MNRISMRRASAYAGVLVATLALAPSAFAHAELFPNQIPSGDGYLLSLAVPNEKEERLHDGDPDHDAGRLRARARRSESGLDLDRDRPEEVNGEMEGGNSITWKGKLSGTELAVLPFTGVPKNAGEYAFTVRQTYSDGSVVEWSGDEGSDTPAARIDGERRREQLGRQLGLQQDDRDHRARRRRPGAARRRRRARLGEARGMRIGGRAGALLVAFAVALALPAAAWGHASLLATQPQASGVLAQPPTQVRLTYSERIEPRFAVISVTDAEGTSRCAGSPATRGRRREHDLRQAAATSPRAGTSSGGA